MRTAMTCAGTGGRCIFNACVLYACNVRICVLRARVRVWVRVCAGLTCFGVVCAVCNQVRAEDLRIAARLLRVAHRR